MIDRGASDPHAAADRVTGTVGSESAGARRRAALAAAARRHAEALPDWEAAVRTFEEGLLALAPEEPATRR